MAKKGQELLNLSIQYDLFISAGRHGSVLTRMRGAPRSMHYKVRH